jgi:hypothetical protein
LAVCLDLCAMRDLAPVLNSSFFLIKNPLPRRSNRPRSAPDDKFALFKSLRKQSSLLPHRALTKIAHTLSVSIGVFSWSRITKYICSLRSKSTKCSRILLILFRLSLWRAGNLLQKSPRLFHPTRLFSP